MFARSGSGGSWLRIAAMVPAVTLACADLPRDPEGTLERVRGGTLVVGASDSPPWILRDGESASGPEADLVREVAERLGARVVWRWGPLEDHLAALGYSAVPPLVLGRMKLPLARRLHDKTLGADADMNRADWLTAGAGIAGITGVGLGFWWADALAGAVISVSIVKDGLTNLSRVVKDLVDHRPTTVDGDLSDVPERVEASVAELDWVERVEVRLREEGHVFAGEVFVTARRGALTAERARLVQERAQAVDWRVHDVVVTPASPPPHGS